MQLGSGDYVYEIEEGWAKLPDGWDMKVVAGVGVDSEDRVYAFNRGDHPMIVFDSEGNVITSWGEGTLNFAHAVYVDASDHLWLTDRYGQVVWEFDTDGNLLQTLGTVGEPAADGGPFHDPTQLAFAPNGDMYVSDGYVNSRTHRFSAAGEHLHSWGEFGDAPGQFNLPHGVWVDPLERVWVADRENSRIQFFNLGGLFLYEWTGYARPSDFYMDSDDVMYVAEIDAGVAVVDMDGKILSRFGEAGDGPGQFVSPHGIWGDSRGNLYLCEVGRENSIHKLRRV